MIITFISLFPKFYRSYLKESILGIAVRNKKIIIRECQIRDFSLKKNRSVDDSIYGGGSGQLIRIDVVVRALNSAKILNKKEKIILLSPSGSKFEQKNARYLSNYNHIIFICGRYEGIDSRIEKYVDEIYSIGDYIVTGGELPALIILDAVSREIPGVLGNINSIKNETFNNGLLKHNQYTRPFNFHGNKVPSIFLSGDHEKILQNRIEEQKNLTKKIRPDLLKDKYN